MKYLIIAAAMVAQLSFGYVEDNHKPDLVECSVINVRPEHANFFGSPIGFGPIRPPVKGDTITLDIAKDKITDLTFDSGNAIQIKQANSPLTRVKGNQVIRYAGTRVTTRNSYQGLLQGNVFGPGGQGYITIDVLRIRNHGGMTLHSLTMECKR